MIRTLCVLGSCGSIGCQALDVCRQHGIHPIYLATGSQIELLYQQIREFHPLAVSVKDEEGAVKLHSLLRNMEGETPEILVGNEGICELSRRPSDMVLGAVSGFAGLPAVMSALKSGHALALANKETLVAAGDLVMKIAADCGCRLIPVDSEHSAIWQCLQGEQRENLRRLWLTASGGPFLRKSAEELENVSVDEALAHPLWSMGAKISIDSATMMNKGLELIEAMHLFDVRASEIGIVVHPEGVIHSAVEFCDGEILAQIGAADMRLPIQLAFSWPERVDGNFPRFNWFDQSRMPLHFEEADFERFPCLRLALEAVAGGGAMPLVLNAANEMAVEAFLHGRCGFMDIPRRIEATLEHFSNESSLKTDSINAIMSADQEVRSYCLHNFD